MTKLVILFRQCATMGHSFHHLTNSDTSFSAVYHSSYQFICTVFHLFSCLAHLCGKLCRITNDMKSIHWPLTMEFYFWHREEETERRIPVAPTANFVPINGVSKWTELVSKFSVCVWNGRAGRDWLPAHYVSCWSQQLWQCDVRGVPRLHDSRGNWHGRHRRAGHGVVPSPGRR